METDCPFLPPQIYRSQRNEPSYMRETLKLLAHIRKSSPEDVAAETTRNACTLFGLPSAE
jgi:TatD DNase family protein